MRKRLRRWFVVLVVPSVVAIITGGIMEVVSHAYFCGDPRMVPCNLVFGGACAGYLCVTCVAGIEGMYLLRLMTRASHRGHEKFATALREQMYAYAGFFAVSWLAVIATILYWLKILGLCKCW